MDAWTFYKAPFQMVHLGHPGNPRPKEKLREMELTGQVPKKPCREGHQRLPQGSRAMGVLSSPWLPHLRKAGGKGGGRAWIMQLWLGRKCKPARPTGAYKC